MKLKSDVLAASYRSYEAYFFVRHSPANTMTSLVERRHLAGVVSQKTAIRQLLLSVPAVKMRTVISMETMHETGVVSGGFGQRIARLSAG